MIRKEENQCIMIVFAFLMKAITYEYEHQKKRKSAKMQKCFQHESVIIMKSLLH